MRSQPWLRIFFPPQQERKVLLRQGPVARVFSPGVLRRQRPLVRQVPKKIVRFASVFPSPPFRSSDFAGPRRSRLYGFHTGTRSLSNRKGRGRRSGGREREHRRAGEGRLVWNRNYCVLIDYPS